MGAKVLSDDVHNYMQYIKSLPDVLECGRKASSGSVSSIGSSGGGAGGGGGSKEIAGGGGSGPHLSTLV